MFNVRKRKYGSSRGGSRKKPRFTFRRGRPTWGSMWKATKKSTWKKAFGKKSTRKRLYKGNGASTSIIGRRRSSTLAQKISRAIASRSLMRNACAKRINATFNTQASYAFAVLQGRPGTLNGMTLYDLFNAHGFAASQGRTRQIYMDYISGEYEITNLCNAVVTIYIHDLVCKQDVARDIANSNPIDKWNEGMSDQLSFNSWNANTIGCKPSEALDFDRFFRTTKVTKIVLNPGQIHKHRTIRYLNRKIKFTEFTQSTAPTANDLNNLRNLTGYTLFTIHGQACSDEADAEAVYMSPANVAVHGVHKLRHHWVSDNTNETYPFNNAVDGPGGSSTNPRIVNDDMGTVENYTVA